jgi:NhaC family Na+:H+ antiporter
MEPRKPSLALTLAVFLSAAALIGASVLVWEVDIHIALILSAMIAIAVGVVVLKYDYATIEKGIIDGIIRLVRLLGPGS